MYQEGKNAKQISEILELKYHQPIYNFIKKHNLKYHIKVYNRKYTLNEDYFNIINTSEQILETNELSSSSSALVAQNIMKVPKTTDAQSDMISQTFSNLELISQLIAETEKKATEGTKLVDTTIHSMDEIHEAVSNISKEVDELNIDSNKISIIVQSTYDTDFVMVQEQHLIHALRALSEHDYQID